MSNRKSAADKLSQEQVNEILDYFKFHTATATIKNFDISRSAFYIMCQRNNVSQHSASEAELLKHLQIDGYDIWTSEQKQTVIDFYQEHSMIITCQQLEVKEYFVKLLCAKNNIKLHTPEEDAKLTNLFRYGVEHYSKTDQSKEHHKEVVLSKTANDWAIIDQKNKQTKKERYNDENYNNRQKFKQTCLEKYNCDNVFQTDIVKQKTKETKQLRYNNETYTNREKAEQTCLEKFNAPNFLASIQGQQAVKDYNLKMYGTEYAFLSSTWQAENKIKAIESRKDNYKKNMNFSELYLQICDDPEQIKNFINSLEDKTIINIANKLNITRDHVYYWLSTLGLLYLTDKSYSSSSYENELLDFIGDSYTVIQNDRAVLDGREIDLYLPELKLGIEFNGTYWHSTLNNPDPSYHYNKSLLAEAKGIRLIHIYEYEWMDSVKKTQIKQMLNIALGRVSTKIYARQCAVKVITNAEAKVLNEQNHLQGHRNAQVTLGLFYNNELVQLMSFSKTKYNRNLTDSNSWEIIRGCPGSNNLVIGGVSKLLKHFILLYKPTNIFSYCDFNKFNGKSYEACGMKFIGYTGPDMHWVLKNGNVVNRQPAKHAELKEQAIAQIFGAGSKKYLLTVV